MEQASKPGSGWNSPQPALTLPGGRAVNPWMTLTALMFGFFMSLLDATIVNIALNDIRVSLKTDLTTSSWVLNSYSLVFAVLLVTMGRFADQFGRKRLFMIGMVLFSLGSLLCAIAPTIELLIFFRALQGIGAAALNPVSLAIITTVFPPAKRGGAIAAWGAAAGLAAAVGPVLGGILIENFDWRWIFYVNLPFCVVGLFMVYRFVPESRDPNATRAIDVLGFLTLSVGMFCLVFAIIEGNDWGWGSAGILGLFAASAFGLIAFFFVETRQAQPILDFSLFKLRSFTAANIVTFMFSVALQGAFLILVLYFITAQGYNELNAAYALIPIPLASFVVSAVSGRFGSKVDPRRLGALGMVLLAAGLLLLSTIDTDATYFDTTWRGILIGFGMGLCFTTFPTIVVSDVPRSKLGVASGAFNTFRQIGFTLGVAILISLYSGQVKDNATQARSESIALVQSNTALPAPVRQGIVTQLQDSANQGGRPTSTQPTAATGQPVNPAVTAVTDQIAAKFKKAQVDAYRITWFVAGLIAVLGLIPVFFTRVPQRIKDAQRQEQGDAPAVAV